jgi:thioredoxin 1
MATVNLTESTFSDTIKGSPIVFVDFWAEWCGPCRNFAPVYEKAAESNADIVFAKVDTEAERGLAGSFEISSIPTLMAIRDGIVLYSQAGALPQEGLNNLIAAIRDVDMEAVRQEIAKANEPKSQDQIAE